MPFFWEPNVMRISYFPSMQKTAEPTATKVCPKFPSAQRKGISSAQSSLFLIQQTKAPEKSAAAPSA